MTDDLTEDQERAAWLEWRRGGIGASDVAALYGMSPWASPMSVWADKAGLGEPDEDNEFMEFGRRAEPMLTGYFEDRTGLHVGDQQAQAVHPETPHHRATLDGRVYESANSTEPLAVVEYKTAPFGQWDEVPDQYAIQVQWQMHCDQRDHAWFGVLHGKTFATYEVPRDQRSIDMLVSVVDAFWTNHVTTGKPPPADGHQATARALAAAYPQPEQGKTVPIDDYEWAIALRSEAAAQEKAAKANRTRADNTIKAAIGDAETGTIKGEPVITYKQQARAGHTVAPSTFRKLQVVRGAK